MVHGPATWESSGARGDVDVEWGDVCEDEQLGASQWDVSFSFFFGGRTFALQKAQGGFYKDQYSGRRPRCPVR